MFSTSQQLLDGFANNLSEMTWQLLAGWPWIPQRMQSNYFSTFSYLAFNVPHKMNCNNFGDPLTFHLAHLMTSVTCMRIKSELGQWICGVNMVFFLSRCFTGTALTHSSQPWRTEWTAGQLCCWRLMISSCRLLTGLPQQRPWVSHSFSAWITKLSVRSVLPK